MPPVPYRQIERTIKSEYCVNDHAQLFRYLNHTPIASATIAQVHRAQLPDGTEVALKVQYMDQERLCSLDLLNLKRLANYLQNHDMSFFDMQSVVKEFDNQVRLPSSFHCHLGTDSMPDSHRIRLCSGSRPNDHCSRKSSEGWHS